MCLACEQDAMWIAYLESQGLLKDDDPAAVEALFGAFPVQPLPFQASDGGPQEPSARRPCGQKNQRREQSIFLRRSDGSNDGSHLVDAGAGTRRAARSGIFPPPNSPTRIFAAIEEARALNAFVLETPDRAREMARAADARLAKGEGGPLEGLPLGVKDLFCTAGVRTTACSHILENFVPTYELTVTANLWRDGAVLLGKPNNDEFAMGSSNETSYFGPVVSPWRRRGSEQKLVPGGSSGGSAAAVAARLCAGATGTDTGGSIRQPAAFCGIVGLKPTYGRCSRWGIVAFASSLDQAGPFARTVRDCAILLRSMAGPDAKDTTCVDLPVPDYEKSVGASVKGMRIGIPKEYRVPGMAAEIETFGSAARNG